jgi:carbonic anhydrase
MNITKQNISGKCDLKCAYNFNYLPSDTVCKNNGTSIELSYEKTSSAPVRFNSLKYDVNAIYIYSPSIHSFNDAKTNAECIIEHVPVVNGETLYVCVPITQSTQTTTAGNMLTSIINRVSYNAPSINETTTLNSMINLSEFIPNKHFINYTGTSGLIGQIIVFSLVDAIPLSIDTLNTLSNIIEPSTLNVTGGKLFLNPDGPNTSTATDGIYISCKPTGSSEEVTEVSYKNEGIINEFNSVYNSTIVRGIFMGFLYVLMFYIINYLLRSYVKQ